jgi:hypothetical protein
MVSPLLLPGLVAGFAGGVVAHELAHYLTARAAGRPAEIDWLAVDTVWGVNRLTPADRAVVAAPYAAGLLVLLAWALGVVPVLTLSWAAIATLFWVGLMGGAGKFWQEWAIVATGDVPTETND